MDLSTTIGIIGGFVGVLAYIFESLNSFYKSKLYYGSILNKIYRLRGMPEISKMKFMSLKAKSNCSCWYSFTYKVKNALFCLWPKHSKQEKVYKDQAKDLWNKVEYQRRDYVENQLNEEG
jgi:hypothetical protein